MSENVLKARISSERTTTDFVDTNSIVTAQLERRVQEIGEDAACLELVASGYVADADPRDALNAIAKTLRLIVKRVGLDV